MRMRMEVIEAALTEIILKGTGSMEALVWIMEEAKLALMNAKIILPISMLPGGIQRNQKETAASPPM